MKSIRKQYKNAKFFFKQQDKKKSKKEDDSDFSQSDDENMKETQPEEDPLENLSLLERLQSPIEDVREVGIISIVNISISTHINSLKKMISEDLLAQILKGFQDPSPTLIMHHIHACMNLVNIDFYQRDNGNQINLAQTFIEKGLFSGLEKLLNELIEVIQRNSENKQKQDAYKIIQSIYYLLSTLCETLNEKNLKLVTDTQLGQGLVQTGFKVLCFQTEKQNSQFQQQLQEEIVNEKNMSIMNFMQVLSECCGVQFAQQILQNQETFQILYGFATSKQFCSQLAVSTLINLVFSSIFGQNQSFMQNQQFIELIEKVYQLLDESIAKVISIGIHEELSNLRNLISTSCLETKKPKNTNTQQQQGMQQQQEDEQLEEDDEDELVIEFDQDLSQSYDKNLDGNNKKQGKVIKKLTKQGKDAIKIWTETSEQILTLITVLINLFEAQDLEEEVEDEEEFGSDGEFEEQKNTNSQQNKNNTNNEQNDQQQCDQIIKQKIVNQMFEKGVLQYLVEKTQMISSENEAFYLNLDPEIVDQIHRVEEYSLSALANFIENYFEKYTQTQEQQQFWQNIFNNLWKNLQQRNVLLCNKLHLNPDNLNQQQNNQKQLLFSSTILNLKIVLQLLSQNSQTMKNIFQIQISIDQVTEFLKQLDPHLSQFTKENQEWLLIFLDICGKRFHPLNQIVSETENSFITDILVNLLQNSKNAMISAQALNTLYDIHSEEKFDNIFVQKNLMHILSSGKDLYSQNMQVFKQLHSKSEYAFIKQTFVNLKRFIEYKKKHIN